MTVWKFDLLHKIQQEFFQAVAISVLMYDNIPLNLMKRLLKKLDGNYTRMLHAVLKILKTAPHKTAAVWSPTSHIINYPSKMNRTYSAQVEKQGQIHKRHSPVGTQTDTLVMTDQQKLTFISSVWTLDAV